MTAKPPPCWNLAAFQCGLTTGSQAPAGSLHSMLNKDTDNDIRFYPADRTVQVIITRLDGSQHTALYDDWHYPALKNIQWHVNAARHKSQQFYAACQVDGKLWLMHRLIFEPFLCPGFPEIDHIDPYKTLDCRARNIRLASRFHNMRNQKRLQFDPHRLDGLPLPPPLPWHHNHCLAA